MFVQFTYIYVAFLLQGPRVGSNDLSMSLFANNTCTAVNSLLFTYGKRIIVHYKTVHLETFRPQYLIHLSIELKQ